MATLLGDVVGVHQIRQATRDVLKAWLPAALVDVARQSGMSDEQIRRDVAFPRSWVRLADFRSLSEDQSPCVVVASARWEAENRRAGEQDVVWRVNVYTVVRGHTYEQTGDLVGIYTAAARAVIIQQLRRHDLLSDVWVLDEQYDALAADSARTIAAGLVAVAVQVDHATVLRARYTDPPADPFEIPSDLPTVTAADVRS